MFLDVSKFLEVFGSFWKFLAVWHHHKRHNQKPERCQRVLVNRLAKPTGQITGFMPFLPLFRYHI
jgi:hypothetical protein